MKNTKKLKNIKIAFICLFFIFLLIPLLTFARGLEIEYPKLPALGGERIETPNEFMEKIQTGEYPSEYALPLYIKYFYYLSLAISGILIFGSMIAGGFIYITSFGSISKVTAGKDQIMSGFIGVIILLSSFIILNIVNPDLVIFKISELKYEPFPETNFDIFELKDNVFFEIPIGMIIERAVLDDEFIQRMDNAKNTADLATIESEKLKKLTDELKKETEKCKCGTTKCYGPSEVCKGISCPNASCNIGEIKKISEKIESAITDLEAANFDVFMAKNPIIDDLSQLEAAAYLMSEEHNKLITYNDFLAIKQYQIDPKIETFYEWQDLLLRVDNAWVKDPLTFYLPKEGNEESIYLASISLSGFYAGPPPGINYEDWMSDTNYLGIGGLAWPTRINNIRISSYYGWRIISGERKFHNGIDITGLRGNTIFGTPAYSMAEGVVIDTRIGASIGYGVFIRHPSLNLTSAYFHLVKNSFNVRPGDSIPEGHPIGLVGSTGYSTGPHLHFEIRRGLARSSSEFWGLRSVDPCKGTKSLEGCMNAYFGTQNYEYLIQ